MELRHNCMPVFQRNRLKERSASSKIRKSARIAWHLVHFSVPRTLCLSESGPVMIKWEQATSSPQDISEEQLRQTSYVCCSCKMRSCSNLAFISLINKNVPVHWPLSRNAKDTKESKTGFRVPSVWSVFWPCIIKGDIILFVPHGQVNSFIHSYESWVPGISEAHLHLGISKCVCTHVHIS